MSLKSSEQPLLSLIIPTKNRSKYAVYALRQALKVESNDFEVVVQDNSTDDLLQEAMGEFVSDPRVVYNRLRESVDVIENFSQSIKISRGKYLAMMGDDDGINPELFQATQWAYQNDVDVLTTTKPVFYFWPDKRMRYMQDRLAGRMDIRPFTGRVQELSVDVGLKYCVARGGVFDGKRMPGAYHAVVRRECLNQAEQAFGTMFPGPSPDLACSIAMSPFVKKFVRMDYPLIISGVSLGNVHALGRADYSVVDLKTKPHLPKQFVDNWSNLVPALFSGPTIWGETTIQALKQTKQDQYLDNFNFGALYANAQIFLPGFKSQITKQYYDLMKEQSQNLILSAMSLRKGHAAIWYDRLSALAFNVRRGLFPRFRNYPIYAANIEQACSGLSKYLTDNGLKIGDFLKLVNV